MGSMFLVIVSVLALFVALPIMVTNLVAAQNTTNAPSDFTAALAISSILLGLAPAGFLFKGFIQGKFGK